MWTYYPELLRTPVPRYTSYPTAAEFTADVGRLEQREGLSDIAGDAPISLYFHIPYCREICWYCGCNTGAANRTERLATYLDCLKQEIALVAAALDGRGRVTRVAFGGGSPNAIAAGQFLDLVARIRSSFTIDDQAVWSIELDPRGFDDSFAAAIASVGIDRASLGVQTFDPSVQAAIGRVQSLELIERATGLLREAGVTSLNFDLMYGLPGQTDEMLRDSLDLSDELGADRLAVFGYAHVPHLVPRQRQIHPAALPGPEERFGMAALACRRLTEAGWDTVGFDHFARPDDPLALAARNGRLRRNFQGFTDDPCEILIGFGASAISRLPNALVQNEKNSGRYGMFVDSGRLAGTRGIRLTDLGKQRAAIIEQLLCNGRADLTPLGNIRTIRTTLEPFARRSLVEWQGNRLTLAPDALPYRRSIAACLDPWRADSQVRFSSAV